MEHHTDTIAAISTPVGEGGIAIIRVPGPKALAIGDQLFCSPGPGGLPSTVPSHTVHYGSIGQNGATIDTVMLTVLHAPRTYTGDDTIEINCHGGMLTAQNVLALCLQHGTRLAEPGEFTRRAFLSGKLDLTQAEAVMDVITAKTDRAQAAATRALQGHLSARVNQARDQLIEILAHLEAYIDFPEDDISPDTTETLRQQTESVTADLEKLLDTAREGRILRHGVTVAIVGRPNAGKSSLLNALLGHERAIVTEIPGTTRDTVDDYANIGGIPVRLTDTAGIHDATGQVEQIGVDRSRQSLTTSDLVIHLIDGSTDYDPGDQEIADHYGDRPAIVAINKSDLPTQVRLPGALREREPIIISAVTEDGLDDLRERLLGLLHMGVAGSQASDVQVNERHARALTLALERLAEAIEEMRQGQPPEIIAQNLRSALDMVGEIVGKTSTEDLLDKIFSTFCIGK